MPHLSTAQEWLTQSSLLMQARPSTTRITTKYTLSSPSHTKSARLSRTKAPPPPAGSEVTPPPPATLTLKTHDTASGTTLKYETNKLQEVGRLVAAMARLGRAMARLPDVGEEVEMGGVEAVGESAETKATTGAPAAAQQQAANGAGGGGKKKKKGKK